MKMVTDAGGADRFPASRLRTGGRGFHCGAGRAGGLVLRLQVAVRHLRPGGTVSGPTNFALADVAMYLAILSRIGPVALTVATSCAVDFLRKPAVGCDLPGEARILKLGQSLAVSDVLVFSAGSPDPVARASLTYSIPPIR